jgi:hypothetical protein
LECVPRRQDRAGELLVIGHGDLVQFLVDALNVPAGIGKTSKSSSTMFKGFEVKKVYRNQGFEVSRLLISIRDFKVLRFSLLVILKP